MTTTELLNTAKAIMDRAQVEGIENMREDTSPNRTFDSVIFKVDHPASDSADRAIKERIRQFFGANGWTVAFTLRTPGVFYVKAWKITSRSR